MMQKLLFRYGQKKYILSQFPYPSGDLHLGHARVYYIGDSLSAYYRLQGERVFYPIGWDSFGLPAENAAIVHGQNPRLWTQNNISRMKKQLQKLNINFDWQAEISTCSSQYYKWTQQIFIWLFKKGLAYRAQAQVNWDPIDQTVLANEQVDERGRSWRSGALVERKTLEQWFLKITSYAQELQTDLQSLKWIDRVKSMQAGWIGYEKGYLLKIEPKIFLKYKEIGIQGQAQLFFRKEGDLYDDKAWIKYNMKEGLSEGQIIGECINPITKKIMKIRVGYDQNGIVQELMSEKHHPNQQLSISSKPTQIMRLKDWLISRQRYWGTPIPIIYCERCGIMPVPEEDLPVQLPQWENAKNPLLLQQFRKCECPQCHGPAQRQTDTMDTFVDSSWYYLRFLDHGNQEQLCSKDKADALMPIDIYIGGIEHAIMHLLYARFIMHFLSDEGICSHKQPFNELVVQGLVKGKTLKLKQSGRYLTKHQASHYKEDDLLVTFEKMSKSKGNGLNPNELVEEYGSDALRLALLFAAPPDHDIDFSEDILTASRRFIHKVQETWHYLQNYNIHSQQLDISSQSQISFKLKNILQKMQNSMEKRYMHAYVANLMQFFNEIKVYIKQHQSHISIQLFDIFLTLMSVVAPQISSSLQLQLRRKAKVDGIVLHEERWPSHSVFGSSTEYLIMRGKSMIKKGMINAELSDEKMLRELGIEGSIKRNRKNIIVVMS